MLAALTALNLASSQIVEFDLIERAISNGLEILRSADLSIRNLVEVGGRNAKPRLDLRIFISARHPTGPVLHVGGPIIGPGIPTVLLAGMPAATVGDMCVCVGPPDSIIKGSGPSSSVVSLPREWVTLLRGGHILAGAPTVMIGG